MKMLYCNCIYQKLSFKYCANISSLILIILQESKGAKKKCVSISMVPLKEKSASKVQDALLW